MIQLAVNVIVLILGSVSVFELAISVAAILPAVESISQYLRHGASEGPSRANSARGLPVPALAIEHLTFGSGNSVCLPTA
jgi:hypothetical protein